jgi:hypothetical protein
LAENPAYTNAKRVQIVQVLASLCHQLGAVSQFEDVTAPNSATPPNYVLLNDVRYRRVWYWYQRLLRHDQEKDRLWDWQSRTWADISRLLVSTAIIWHLKECDRGALRISALYQGSLKVRGEQLLGCRAAAGSETGPLHIERIKDGATGNQWVLEIVHPEQAEHHPIGRHLGATGGHLYLVARPLGRSTSPQVLILWAAHTAASASATVPSWNDISDSAVKALQGHQVVLNMARMRDVPKLHGLVLCSNLGTVKSDIKTYRDGLQIVSVPTKPWLWMSAVEDIALVLDAVLEEMLT